MEHTEAEAVLAEQERDTIWVDDYLDEWEIDSDGHWHERSPMSIEMPD